MDTLLEAVKEWAKNDPGAVPEEIKARLKLSSTVQDSESDVSSVVSNEETVLMLLIKLYSVQPSSVGGDGKVPYEIMREGNIQMRKKVLEALKEAEGQMDTDIPFKPGDTLNVLHCGEIVAECIFLRKRDAMYCDVILVKHRKRPQNREIPLPERCDNKLMLYELEKNDQFTRKFEKLGGGAGASKWPLRSKSKGDDK